MKNNLKPYIKLMEKASPLIITHKDGTYYVSDSYAVLAVPETVFQTILMPLSPLMRETPDGTNLRRIGTKEMPTQAPLIDFEKIMTPLNPSYPAPLTGFFMTDSKFELEIMPTPGNPALIDRRYTDAIRAAIPGNIYGECQSNIKPFFFWDSETMFRFCVLPVRLFDETYNRIVAFAKALNID